MEMGGKVAVGGDRANLSGRTKQRVSLWDNRKRLILTNPVPHTHTHTVSLSHIHTPSLEAQLVL